MEQMLNINVTTLANSLTFSGEYWAQELYLDRDAEESIDDAIRRIIPNEMHSGIEQFISDFRNLQRGDEVDYSALVKDWPTALDGESFFIQVREAEESRLQEYYDLPESNEDDDAMQEYDEAMRLGLEEGTKWGLLLVTYLEMWQAKEMWKALRRSLVVGELVRLHDNNDRTLVGLVLGRLEVLVDGCVIDLAVDSEKIEEKLSLLSLAA